MKKCTKCETEKDASDFNKNKKLPGGRKVREVVCYIWRVLALDGRQERAERLRRDKARRKAVDGSPIFLGDA